MGYASDARVITDHACMCGYNLYGNTLSGTCPECGALVMRSLVPLDDPLATGDLLRSIGRWHLTIYMVAVLTCLPLYLPIAILAVAALARFLTIGQLRREDGIRTPVDTGAITRLWWYGSAVETAWCGAAGLALFLGLPVSIPQAAVWLMWSVLSVSMLVNCVGMECVRRLGRRWDLPRIRREAVAALLMTVLGPVAGFIVGAIGAAGGAGWIGFALGVGLFWVPAVTTAWIVVEHAARVAEQQQGVMDDVLEQKFEPLSAAEQIRRANLARSASSPRRLDR
jgi:hypothetical protein